MRLFAVSSYACFLLASIGVRAEGIAEQPTNIVVILADDVGLGDIGFYHRERTGQAPLAPTPAIDKLARSGMRFSDAHSSTALCSPTRYSVMCGQHPYRSYAPWGVWGSFRETPFTPHDATLGRVGKQAGMVTGFFGKWHLGGNFLKADGKGVYRGPDRGEKPLKVDATRLVDGGPSSVGFDHSWMLPCGIQGPFYAAYEDETWSPLREDSRLIHYDAESAADRRFVSDKGPGVGDSAWDPRETGEVLSSRAVEFMHRCDRDDRPFLMYYCSPMVHVPHIPPAEFDGTAVAGETPTAHLDMLIDLDCQVARIIDELKRAGTYDNTLLVFTSDNGGLLDGKALRAGHDSSNAFRGSKNKPYEGGHRVPMFVVWPERIASDSVCDRPVAVHDLVATCAGATGQTLEEDQAKDSLNLLPLLLGEGDPTTERTDFLLQGGSGFEAVYRTGDWKLIIQTDHKLATWEPIALFNLSKSPLEPPSANLIESLEHACRVQKMLKRYLSIRQSGERTAPLAKR